MFKKHLASLLFLLFEDNLYSHKVVAEPEDPLLQALVAIGDGVGRQDGDDDVDGSLPDADSDGAAIVAPPEGAPEAGEVGEGGAEAALAVPLPPDVVQQLVGDLVAADVLSRGVADRDLDVLGVDVGAHFLVSKDHMTSEEAESHVLSCDRKTLRELRLATADICWHLERHCWHRIERHLITPNPNKVIVYVNMSTYDGVDLLCLTNKFWRAVGAMAPALEGAEAQGVLQDLSANLREEILKTDAVDASYGASKIQHTNNMVAIVVHIGARVVYLVGHLSALLLAVDHSTGEAILATVKKQDAGSDAREQVARRIRLSESDGAGYNDRTEKGWLQKMPGWFGLKFSCEVHYCSGTHAKVYDIPKLRDDITGMIQTGLALKEFGMIMKFRDAGRKVLKRIVVIVDDMILDDGAQPFKDLVLDEFLGKGPAALAKRGVLLRLAPGDWRMIGTWPWRRLGDETLDQVLELILEGVSPILWGHSPFEFPRSRWTGAEKTFADIGLPSNLHGIEYLTAQQFRRDLGEPDEPPRAPAAPAPAPAPGPAAAPVLDLPPPPVGLGDAGGVVAPLAAAPAPEAAPPGAEDIFKDLPKQNLAHRTFMLGFLSSDPGLGGTTILYTIYNNYIKCFGPKDQHIKMRGRVMVVGEWWSWSLDTPRVKEWPAQHVSSMLVLDGSITHNIPSALMILVLSTAAAEI